MHFAVLEEHYPFTALPLGLATVPLVVHQNIGSSVSSFEVLRVTNHGVHSVAGGVYCNPTDYHLVLRKFMWILNLLKSLWIPSLCLEYLGLIFDKSYQGVCSVRFYSTECFVTVE